MTETERRIGLAANAIGWALFAEDGRPVGMVDGVESIDLSEEEKALCLKAAERVVDHLDSAA